MQVLQITLQGGPDIRGWACTVALRSLHGVERGCECNRPVVQVPLKILVGGEPQTLHNTNSRRGVGPQASGKGANAEQDIRTRLLQHGADDFLSLGAETVQ